MKVHRGGSQPENLCKAALPISCGVGGIFRVLNKEIPQLLLEVLHFVDGDAAYTERFATQHC